jgi:hypothetical protein
MTEILGIQGVDHFIACHPEAATEGSRRDSSSFYIPKYHGRTHNDRYALTLALSPAEGEGGKGG